MVEKYKHIIWDWNGTIFNDVLLGIEIINDMLKERGQKLLTVESYREIFTIPVKDYYGSIGFNFMKEPFEVVGKIWMDEYERRKYEFTLYDGIIDVLDKIKSLGIGQSILSAYSQHTLDEMIDHYDLRKYFDHVVGLDNIYAASKINIGKELMTRLGNGKGETVMIGDTIHDYEVAKEIGAESILLSYGHQSKTKLFALGVPVLDKVEDLLA
jgi:phosphoglycolate phosphatase